MAWHGYFRAYNLPPGWTNEQRLKAFAAMGTMGKQDDPSPAKNNHIRLSDDGTEIIYEAEFTDEEIVFDSIVTLVAEALSLPEPAVRARLRVEYFAGIGSTWMNSRDACAEYLLDHSEEWDGDPE